MGREYPALREEEVMAVTSFVYGQRIRVIRDVLQKERQMRNYVFRNDHPKRVTKVAEIDAALRALQEIEEQLDPPGQQEQLF